MQSRDGRTAALTGWLTATLLCSALVSPAAETFDCCAANPLHRGTAETAVAVPPVAPPRLHLVCSDPLEGLRFSFEHVARELASTLGVQVTWRPLSVGGAVAPQEILVVLLDSEPPGRSGSSAMGSVNRMRVSRTLWVMLPNVERTASGRPSSADRWLPRDELARAIARVIAHEIVHLLAPAVPHAPRGLMCARLGPAELLRARPWLDPDTWDALREALGRLPGNPRRVEGRDSRAKVSARGRLAGL